MLNFVVEEHQLSKNLKYQQWQCEEEQDGRLDNGVYNKYGYVENVKKKEKLKGTIRLEMKH